MIYPYNMQIAYDEFPYVCSPCLGAKDAQLILDSLGDECRMCQKPFTTYKWTTPAKRFRSTIICKACAESNEACQSCIRDIKYNIDLHIRRTALRILEEEGGNSNYNDEVLRRVSEAFSARSDRLFHMDSKLTAIKTIINRLPLPIKMGNQKQPGENKVDPIGRVLYVYGIEEDLDINELRSYLKASIEQIELSVQGRYAIIVFSPEQAPLSLPDAIIFCGRRLVFAWGNKISIPASLQRSIGAVVRAYLKQY